MTSKELGICVHVCWKTVSAGPNHKDLPGPWEIRGSSWREAGRPGTRHKCRVEELTLFQQSYFTTGLNRMIRLYWPLQVFPGILTM